MKRTANRSIEWTARTQPFNSTLAITMKMDRSKYIQMYAVVRVDGPVKGPDQYENMITVKEIVPTLENAAAEVARLNKLNQKKGCPYFWQTTKVFHDVKALPCDSL